MDGESGGAHSAVEEAIHHAGEDGGLRDNQENDQQSGQRKEAASEGSAELRCERIAQKTALSCGPAGWAPGVYVFTWEECSERVGAYKFKPVFVRQKEWRGVIYGPRVFAAGGGAQRESG